jgi:N-acetylglutamate synthase-like GNAT family acetyltransferase
MVIRVSESSDIDQINELAEKYGLDVPHDGTLVVAEDSEGSIKAFVNLRPVMMVSPFVAENPVMGKKLYDYCEEKLKQNNYSLLQCYVEPYNKGLLEKLGFKQIFSEHIIMEKLLAKETVNV